jgi:hypothetical protein
MVIPLSRETHSARRWLRYTSYHFAAKTAAAPLVSSELGQAVRTLPLAFTRHRDRFVLVAVLSTIPNQNLYVAPNGKWLGGYVPAAFRGYPFSLARQQGTNDLVLCVDETSGLITENPSAGEPLFDTAGALAGPVAEVLNFLKQIEQHRIVTNRAVAAMAEAGLIIDWPLKPREGQPVTGLYKVDEAKLGHLDPDTLMKLYQARALPVAYAQLFSMANMQVFDKLAKIQEQAASKTPDAGSFLADDDVISFQ